MGNGSRTQARRVLLRHIASAYHQASGPQKQHILEEFVNATRYARKYALWLLNHVEEVFAPPATLRRRYEPEVEEALVLVWKTLNRICTKRLIPFLPDMLETLEEQGHIQLCQEQRSQLLSMSAATADRLLQAHRYTHPHGLPTTKAGPMLKQQFPIRAFGKSGRSQTRLAFRSIRSRIVAGDCLYTLTLTDIATHYGILLPVTGALPHELSSLTVIANSARLIRVKDQAEWVGESVRLCGITSRSLVPCLRFTRDVREVRASQLYPCLLLR